MATKYIINEGYDNVETVEGADSVRFHEGFFYFYDVDKTTVFVQNADSVQTVKRTT